jgi:hypothetical protein
MTLSKKNDEIKSAAKKKKKKDRRDRKKLKRVHEDESAPEKLLPTATAQTSTDDASSSQQTRNLNVSQIPSPKPPEEKRPRQEHRHTDSRNKDTVRPSYEFQVDDTDHCETPLEAYRDLLELLDQLATSLGKTRSTLSIYDPYYCNGGVQRKLQSLGFSNVINRNRDFYQDIAEQTTPEYDVLITNPPYSGIHMEKLLAFCATRSGKPFLLLLPHFVYTKDYYARALGLEHHIPSSQPYFLVPHIRYSYVPPKWVKSDNGSLALSKGKEKTAPFPSFWYCGVDERLVAARWLSSTYGPSGQFTKSDPMTGPSSSNNSSRLRYANCTKDIPRDFKGEFDATKKRPNPKARKRAAAVAAKKRREAGF